MKNFIKKLIIISLALLLTHQICSASVSAASSINISGGDQVSGGEIFTVTVTFDGDNIGRVAGDVTYDTEMLSYISGGSSSGNVGYIELKQAGTGEALTFDLKFQALKEGSTSLEVSAGEMYDLDEMFMDTPSASKTVTITGDADKEEIVEETTAEEDNAEDEALSVDENDDVDAVIDPSGETVADGTDSDSEDSDATAKYIMFGIGALVLILLVAMIFRRKK